MLGFDPAQRRLLREAEDLLIADCMSDRGFEYMPYPDDETAPISMAELYGSISVEQAETYGYHNPNARELARQEEAILAVDAKVAEQGPEYFTALYGDADSCRSMANRELYGTDEHPRESNAALQILQLAGDTLTVVNSSARFAAAANDWRNCMNASGYDVEVLSDSRMSYPSDPTDTRPPDSGERSMAVTDARCRLDAELDTVVVALYSEAFEQLLDERPGVREELTSAFARAETQALAVVSNGSTASS